MNDAIFATVETLSNEGRQVCLLQAHQGWVLRISQDALALYRSRQALDDPLGNGCVGYCAIPVALQPYWQERDGYVASRQAGFVGLNGGAALFVRPDGIALYPSAQAALANVQLCHFLSFESLTV